MVVGCVFGMALGSLMRRSGLFKETRWIVLSLVKDLFYDHSKNWNLELLQVHFNGQNVRLIMSIPLCDSEVADEIV